MCEVGPSYKEYVSKDGTILVKMKKDLYGLIKAPKRWNVQIADLLRKFGFQQHPLEPCVFVYKADDGVCYLLLYIHRLYQRSPAGARQGLYQQSLPWYQLERRQSAWLSGPGDRPDVAKLSMTGYIKDLLETTGTIGYADSPAGPHLFEVCPDEEAELLDKAAAKSFHTVVMKCHYLAKRMRFEILTAVAGLATRVQNPDLDDKLKLNRLLCYLNKVKEQLLKIRIDPAMQITAYIDASYAVHSNMMSLGGMCITMGSGCSLAKPYQIKLSTKSSTESELVAASDNLGEALFIHEFLTLLGYKLLPVLFLENNMSTIALIKNGRPESDASRHIKIRYYWVHHRAEVGDVILQHCSTEDMLAVY